MCYKKQRAKWHDPYPLGTQKAESAGFFLLWRGKLLTGKNMTDLGQNRHFFPAIIIPSKVSYVTNIHFSNFCNLRIIKHKGHIVITIIIIDFGQKYSTYFPKFTVTGTPLLMDSDLKI